jgi:hypothetical protein
MASTSRARQMWELAVQNFVTIGGLAPQRYAVLQTFPPWTTMKTAAATFLLVGILAAHQAYGEAVSVQPLTRVDCSRAAMAWDESANVCGANSRDLSGQPLTRLDCVEAGMQWNDSANVCGTTPAAVTILKPDARDDSSQPLARNQCEMAGLRWNYQANVMW